MRNPGKYLIDVFRKAPVVFPLVGLFHLSGLIWILWSDRKEPFPGLVWLQPLWLAGYTFFWLWACGLKKMGAAGYIALTVLDLILFLAARNHLASGSYPSPILFIDVLFSLALLYYFKRFER